MADTHHGPVAASRLAAELGHFSSVRLAKVQFPHRIHLKVSDDGLSRTQIKTIREFGWDVSGFSANGVSVIKTDRLLGTRGVPA